MKSQADNCPKCGGDIIGRFFNRRICWQCESLWTNKKRIDVDDTVSDAISHPSHYTSRGNFECVQVTELFNFCRGNAIKYIWRAGLKSKDTEIEDLEKAVWYINREIARLKQEAEK